MSLIKISHDKELKYSIYQSEAAIKFQKLMVQHCHLAHERFKLQFPDHDGDSTWSYQEYNVASLMYGSEPFYYVWRDIRQAVRDFMNTDEPLWIQSWLNFHTPDQVLKWHSHANTHGFISIDPKKTKTVFREGTMAPNRTDLHTIGETNLYEIDNEVGKIYIGASKDRVHQVEVLEDFDTPRITIAFDINTKRDRDHGYKNAGYFNISRSLLPLD